MKICGLILAAGASSRLGRPKQLVSVKGKSLLEKAIKTALEAGLNQVYVVLGAHFDEVKASIAHLPVRIIHHEQWQQGIGSSISAGMQTIHAEDHYDAVLIMLCDQLHINIAHLKALLIPYLNSDKAIVATSYGNQTGVPALFDHQHFSLLQALSGDTGAKKIISQQADKVHSIRFEEASIDIDTPEDLAGAGLA